MDSTDMNLGKLSPRGRKDAPAAVTELQRARHYLVTEQQQHIFPEFKLSRIDIF